MPAETPDQYELNILRPLLREIEAPSPGKTRRALALFAIFGFALLVGAYILRMQEGTSPSWSYFMCFLAGMSIGSAAIVNRLCHQSRYILRYIDKAAVARRINELECNKRL